MLEMQDHLRIQLAVERKRSKPGQNRRSSRFEGVWGEGDTSSNVEFGMCAEYLLWWESEGQERDAHVLQELLLVVSRYLSLLLSVSLR